MSTFSKPPDTDAIVDLADRALAALPAPIRARIGDVAITVEDFADDETLRDMEIESEWDLSGLYRGTPLQQRSVMDTARPPDMIFLYRQPILLEWIEADEDLYQLVRNVLIHEIAHHFGFSDAEIEALENAPEE